MDLQIAGLSSSLLLGSTRTGLPFAVLVPVYLTLALACWSPALPRYFCISASCFCPQQFGLAVSGGFWDGQVCAVIFCCGYFYFFCCCCCLTSAGLGAWGLVGVWRFQVTLFSGPSSFQAPGEGFPLGGSRFQGCHGYLPFRLWLLLPANLSGTSSQAHLFVMSLKQK